MAVECAKNKNLSEDIFYIGTNLDNKKARRCFGVHYRSHWLVFGSLIALLLLSIVIWMIVLVLKHDSPTINNYIISAVPQSSTNVSSTNNSFQFSSILPEDVNIISRTKWMATPPSEPLDLLTLPVPYVIIMHTATENCSDTSSCILITRFIQTFHMESREWNDIGYNFLVGGDGFIYEGRGWKYVGAHTYGYNSKSIGIAFIGNFNKMMCPKKQIYAAQQLIQQGLELGYLSADYKLLGARQIARTESPGLMLYENIKSWSHWSPYL